MGDLVKHSHKSDMERDVRRTQPVEIERWSKKNKRPTPQQYNPKFDLVEHKDSACLSFKGELVSFASDAMWRGLTSPQYHLKKHTLTEKRVSARAYRPPGRHELGGPSFLRCQTGAKLVSPATYTSMDSWKQTQLKRPSFFMAKGRGGSLVDQAEKKSKQTPGAGHYDVNKLDKAHKACTLGASRGWK